MYFDLREVKLLLGVLAIVLGFYPDPDPQKPNTPWGLLHQKLAECIKIVEEEIDTHRELQKKIQFYHSQISDLAPGDTLDLRIADLVYEFLAVAPFTAMVEDANRARNLATLSRLFVKFQQFYGYTVITSKNIDSLRWNLFNSYLQLLVQVGVDEYEDPDQPFPINYVPIMTIHQAKGLEFPVVVVGSLNVQEGKPPQIDQKLQPYCRRGYFEPLDRYSEFDLMRLHYVAYSRAEKILMLTADGSEGVEERHLPIWNTATDWGQEVAKIIGRESWDAKPKLPPKKPYSFTGDLKAYETCPRQYQLYRLFEFEPSRAVLITFGLLVHQTVEDIHRRTLEGRGAEVTEQYIDDRFEFNYRHLMSRATRKMGEEQKIAARNHVMNYWRQNQAEIARVQETEVDVSLEKGDYILHGAIDLVLGDTGSLEVLDFKAQTRPDDDKKEMRDSYYKQLCIYAHILEQRKGITPSKLHIYWTGESDKKRALMTFDFRREDVDNAAAHFDQVVGNIRAEKFAVVKTPEEKVCNECDFKPYCESVGTIKPTKRKKRRF
jgi:DNA helicase-2/ATP-dependent DNA helicase PcrA